MKEKDLGGRPTDYTPEIGERVLKMFNKGMSVCAIARALKVSRKTIYNWCETAPGFLLIFEKGKDFSQAWWEEKGRKNLENKQFSAVLWMMNIKKRFRDEWKDDAVEKQDLSNLIDETRELVHKCKT